MMAYIPNVRRIGRSAPNSCSDLAVTLKSPRTPPMVKSVAFCIPTYILIIIPDAARMQKSNDRAMRQVKKVFSTSSTAEYYGVSNAAANSRDLIPRYTEGGRLPRLPSPLSSHWENMYSFESESGPRRIRENGRLSADAASRTKSCASIVTNELPRRWYGRPLPCPRPRCDITSGSSSLEYGGGYYLGPIDEPGKAISHNGRRVPSSRR